MNRMLRCKVHQRQHGLHGRHVRDGAGGVEAARPLPAARRGAAALRRGRGADAPGQPAVTIHPYT